jgi:hypothetical protein
VTGAAGTSGIIRRLRPSFWDMSVEPARPGDPSAAARALRKIYAADEEPPAPAVQPA